MALLNKDTKDKIVNYVNDFYRCDHRTPSVREIAAGLGIGKSTVHNYLVAMNELKEIIYDGINNCKKNAAAFIMRAADDNL